MRAIATADLCDANEPMLLDGTLRALPPVFRDYGRATAFHGPVTTLRLFEDNALVRAALSEPGAGRVLVVDGGGSLRCALLGGNLGALAARNGWAGVVVHGCVRDVDELAGCDVGVRALAAHPRKSRKDAVGERDAPVEIAGVAVRPGEWCYADADGALISARRLHD
jgi:regulator of ribonuclease activity A